MAVETVAYPVAYRREEEDASFEERWAAWQSRCLEHDRKFRKRVAVAAVTAALLTFGFLLTR